MTPVLGEVVGTAIMILLGDGVVANVLLSRSKGENAGWMVIAHRVGFSGIRRRVLCGHG